MPDTIVALSSGRPPAAIAVIRISGPSAHEVAQALCGALPAPRAAAVRTLRDPDDGSLLDEALVLRFDGPASATGEDTVELHCHGGRAVVAAVLDVLERQPNLRAAEPGEFTRRAFDNGRIDLMEAEGLADLLEAETETQRRAAQRLADGDLSRQVAAWTDAVVGLSAQAERAIDYAEEDEEAASTAIGHEAAAIAAEIGRWLDQPRVEPLKDGIRVVFAGPPNAGKSSLINAIAEVDRIIVSDVAGTTRDVVEVPLALHGIPFVLTDTAGVRETQDPVEAEGVGRARRQLEVADILVWLGDEADMPSHPSTILVRAKSDVVDEGAGLRVSAHSKEGLGALRSLLIEQAKTLLPSEGQIAINQRHANLLEETRRALVVAGSDDAVIQAEGLRAARSAFDHLTGRSGVEDVLDAIFSRFCLGK